MPRLLCLLLITCFVLPVQAGDTEACLRGFARALLPGEAQEASFQMHKQLPRMKKPLQAAGRVLTDPERGLVWETTSPLKDVRIFGKNRYAFTDENARLVVREHQAASYISEMLTQTPDALIETLRQNFFVNCTQKDGRYDVIVSPKNGPLANMLTEAALYTNRGRLERVSFTQTNGVTTRIAFSGIKALSEISAHNRELFDHVR